MGDCREIFSKLQNLPQTALFLLLRENPDLRSRSIQELAQFCGLARKTVRSYLDDIESYGLIRRNGSLRNEPIQIVYHNLIDEFVDALSSQCVWSPYLNAPNQRSREEWRSWLFRLHDSGHLTQREATLSAVENFCRLSHVKNIFHLQVSDGTVMQQNTPNAACGDFILIEMTAGEKFASMDFLLFKIKEK